LNLIQQQLDEVLEHQNQMLRHQELLLQKKNDLRLLEERISTNQQIIEQQQQQQLQPPAPQPQQSHQNQQQSNCINSNKKARKEKAAARTTTEFHSPDPTITASQAPQPVSTGEASSPADYGNQHQSESTTRLKPLTERRLKRKVLWKRMNSFSPQPERSDKKQSLITPRVTPEQQCLETSSSMSSSMSSSTFYGIPKTHISKSAVMEFYLKEKLREASVREFEMMLMNN
jgi:hypothetical protein